MADEIPDEDESELVSRPPQEEDLVALCRALNELGARYLICGGFAARSFISARDRKSVV